MFRKRTQQCTNRERGTLLVEMLAAFAIVSVTLVMTADSFISAQSAYRTNTAQAAVVNAVGLVLSDMTHEARVSENYSTSCGGCSNLDMTRIAGVNGQLADDVEYTLSSGRIEKSVAGASGQPITPTSISVDEFRVFVFGGVGGAPLRAFINIEASSAEVGANAAPVRVQTTLTVRDL
jgi:type II secretory pathway component PulJ